jgi:hypothetical protein
MYVQYPFGSSSHISQTSDGCLLYPPKADIVQHGGNVHLWHKRTFSPYSMSVLARRLCGMVRSRVLQFSPKSVQPMNFLCLAVVSYLRTSVTLIGKS